MATRNENLNRIRNAMGSYSPDTKNTTQMNGPRYEETSRDESMRILQSALSGGTATQGGTGPAVTQPEITQPTVPSTSSGAVAPPSPQGEGLVAQGTGRSAEQVQQEKPLTAADYDKLIREKEAELARWEEWDFDATNPTEWEEYDNGIKAYENEIESLKAAKWKAGKEEQYGQLKNNADYETHASPTEEKPTAGFGIGLGTLWWGKGDPVYDYINDIDGTREKWKNPSTMGHSPYSIYDYLDEDEIKTYNYLYNTDGKEAAGKYLDYIEYALNERSTKRIAQSAAEMADKHPVATSAASIPTNLVSGIGLADVALQNLKREFTGEYVPIDYNRSTMAPSVMTSTIRGTVAQNIADSTGVIALDEEEHPVLSKVFNGKSLGDVYQLGMSIADSTAVALTPFGQYGAVLLGGSAGTQGMLDALERGASDEQAIKMGLLNATFEALFEFVSLDKLITGNPKNLVLALLQQGGVEASEEAATTLANNVADILVMAEKSDYQLKIQAYMESGMSREEATKQALLDKCIELGWDAAGGFFSGSVMGGSKYGLGNIKAHKGDSQQRSGMETGAENAQTQTEPTTQPAAETQAKPYQTVEELIQPIQPAENTSAAETAAAATGGNAPANAGVQATAQGQTTGQQVMTNEERAQKEAEWWANREKEAEKAYEDAKKRYEDALNGGNADETDFLSSPEMRLVLMNMAKQDLEDVRNRRIPSPFSTAEAQTVSGKLNTQNGSNASQSSVRNNVPLQQNIDNGMPAAYNNPNRMNGGAENGIRTTGLQQNDAGRSAEANRDGLPGGYQGSNSDNPGQRKSDGFPVDTGFVLISENARKRLNERGVAVVEARDASNDKAAFSSALDSARNADTKNGWAVTPKSAEELEKSGARLIMDAQGSAGLAVAPDGDIEAVFANHAAGAPKSATKSLIPIAIANGGTKLDCYGEGLVTLYAKYGFTPVARVKFDPKYANPGWDSSKGTPDIFFMMHDGDSADTVVDKIGTYPIPTKSELEALPEMDYDSAYAYRDRLLAERSSRGALMGAADAQNVTEGGGTTAAQNASQTAPGELNTQAETNTQEQTENAEADAQFNELAERYGAIPTGETPARDVQVPQRISADEAVGRTARTIMEAASTPDNRLGSVREAVVDGKFSYVEISNQKLADSAAQRIERDGWQKSLADWTAAVRQNQANEKLVAMGAQLLNNAGNSDMSAKQYVDLAADYNRLTHNMGRGLAATRILKTLSPEGKLYGILRSVQSMVDEANGKYNVEIDQALIDEYRAQTTDEGRDAVISKMQQNIADQIPSTWMDKFTALRYTNMLGNFKTQARNISGNILMTLGRTVKDKLAAVIESAASAASGGQVERTKSLWAGTPLYGEAMRDFTNVEREAMGESKYSDSVREFDREVQEKRTIFKNNGKWGTDEAETGIGRSAAAKGVRKVSDLGMAGMEAYRKATNWAMEQGDRIFVRINYADALAGWLKAHNIDAEQWRSLVNEERKSVVGTITAANRKTPLTAGTVVKALDRGNYGYVQGFDGSSYSVRFVAKSGAEATVKLSPAMVVPTNAKTVEEARSGETKGSSIVSRARQYAIKQAQEATFRDTNSVSQFVSTFDKGWEKTGFGRGAQKVMQGIAPFRKTPANVAVRAEEYSPLGILNTAYKAFEAKQGKNDVTWSDVIDSAAKTLTGSGIYFLGYLMAAAGSARGKEEDEKKAAFENMQGLQDYSIILPNGKSISMDWVAPYSIPFFMGVLTQEAAADGGLSWDDAGKILGAVSDPMLEMSMLSGLNDALDNISQYNGDADALPQFLMNAFASYLSQGVTNTLLGQFEQASQENRQTTYTDSTLKIPTSLQYILGKASAKTPGVDYNQQDYIDAWGRKQSTGTAGERIINSFINPAYVNEDRSTPVDDELQRLYDAGQTNVLPQKASRSTKVNGERLSPEEYEAYSITKGQQSLELVQDFIESDAYKDMSDEARADVISDLYSFAASRAAKEIADGRKESYTSDWDDEAKLSDVVGYLTSKSQIQTAQDSKDYTLLDALIDTVTEQKKDIQGKLNKDFSMLDELIYGKENGVDSKTIYTAKEKADANGNGSVTQEEMWNYLETQVIMPSSKKSVLWDILTSGKTGYAEYAEKHK